MLGIHDWWLFIISGVLLNLMPGPDTLFIMSKSASQGWKAGVVASLGICSGVYVHVFAAAFGLSALLATSATAFVVVKLVGAAYLIYLGWMTLRQTVRATSEANTPVVQAKQPLFTIYRQGFLTNALNPKVALFFLAFVPQFISADATNTVLAFILLGTVFDMSSLIWCTTVALFTAFASERLQVGAGVKAWLNKVVGGLFIALGIRLAVSAQS
ncbi:LysE family translocator [uncultured Thiothrix sp.]|uniref:LysE family translocator n=1 Tax=uncultured Thiothrix sp. TaxID=223185 RepID=UPI0026207068|nr:LysE family translocator [uncultured Thiothrix sp.]